MEGYLGLLKKSGSKLTLDELNVIAEAVKKHRARVHKEIWDWANSYDEFYSYEWKQSKAKDDEARLARKLDKIEKIINSLRTPLLEKKKAEEQMAWKLKSPREKMLSTPAANLVTKIIKEKKVPKTLIMAVENGEYDWKKILKIIFPDEQRFIGGYEVEDIRFFAKVLRFDRMTMQELVAFISEHISNSIKKQEEIIKIARLTSENALVLFEQFCKNEASSSGRYNLAIAITHTTPLSFEQILTCAAVKNKTSKYHKDAIVEAIKTQDLNSEQMFKLMELCASSEEDHAYVAQFIIATGKLSRDEILDLMKKYGSYDCIATAASKRILKAS